MKRSKRYLQSAEKVKHDQLYSFAEAVSLLKSMPKGKMDESVDIAIKLGINSKQADQAIRGSFSLPNGLGKAVRVIAFVDDALVDQALAAGAIMAGSKDLADKIKNEEWFEFDVAVAEPKMMRVVGQLGRVLGPKGLMPSPKAGTVVPDPVRAVAEFAAGKKEYKNDAAGNVQYTCGKISIDADKIKDNLEAFYKHIVSIRPATVKGIYVESVFISATMSPSIRIAI